MTAPLERIIPEHLRERFGGRMSTGHTVGRCAGESEPFPGLGLAPVRCTDVVSADTGFVGEADNTSFGTGKTRLYYCKTCAQRIQQGG